MCLSLGNIYRIQVLFRQFPTFCQIFLLFYVLTELDADSKCGNFRNYSLDCRNSVFQRFPEFQLFFHFSVPDVYLEPEMCQGQAV